MPPLALTHVPPPRLYKIKEICAFLQVSKATVYRMMQAKKLPFLRISGSRRVSQKQLDELIEGAQVGVTATGSRLF